MISNKKLLQILDAHAKERNEWMKERQKLLDRIQAPERAAFEFDWEQKIPKQYAGFENDIEEWGVSGNR